MIALLVRFVRLALWAVALPWLVLRRVGARVPLGTHLLVEIDGVVGEVLPRRRWWPPGAPRALSLHALGGLVNEVIADPRIRGLIITIRSMRCGFATSTSLRAVIARVRGSGKRVVVHLPNGGSTKEAYVAASADRVVLGPQVALAPVGILSATRYVRGALDRAGVVPEVYARGRFKTAAEPLERTTMSEAQREQLDAVLDGLYAELIRAISEGRDVDAERARAIVDGAPYLGEEAVEAGVADATAYDDELAERAAGDGPTTIRRADTYESARRALRCSALEPSGVIAVVRVHGAIVAAPSIPLRMLAVDDRVISAVRLARASPHVRGVVLHVDSPGGSAQASDRIHRELVKLAAEKPLVACLGDVSASGGYYVAAAAGEIVAQPTTITGSIGVVAARVVVDPLLARLGIVTEALQRGAHARLLDSSLRLGNDEQRAIQREVERTYQAFLRVVAQGRARPVEEIEPLAQGRVWTGEDARARGLVDRLGGFDQALDSVRQRIGRGADRMRVVVVTPPRKLQPWPETRAKKAARMLADTLEPLAHSLGFDAGLLALARERVLLWSGGAASLRL